MRTLQWRRARSPDRALSPKRPPWYLRTASRRPRQSARRPGIEQASFPDLVDSLSGCRMAIFQSASPCEAFVPWDDAHESGCKTTLHHCRRRDGRRASLRTYLGLSIDARQLGGGGYQSSRHHITPVENKTAHKGKTGPHRSLWGPEMLGTT